ncbi:cytochrome P450 [Halioxenophilus sp. WMMB6]|uniref:cytochrome P450 n=1 Tax=Halioxenophilus sp. WMMB6 TaxID=3073815 RepID=UPI00295EFF90|nr:cytochrome P450 [Halioxenophilus sp. WMMB6]
MQRPTDLHLLDLPIGEQIFADNPDPYMVEARKHHPWLANSTFGLVLTERDAVDEVLRLDEKLKTPASHIVEIMGGEGTNWARFQHECLIARDGDIHDRIRKAVAQAFRPAAVMQYKQRIQLVIGQLLDEWAPKGEFDFEEFASRFPVAVMFGLLGIPRDRIEDVKYWLEMLGQSFCLNKDLFPEINSAFNGLWDFADSLIESRFKAGNSEPKNDILDTLVSAETEGVLSRNEVLDLVLFMFAGGYDTSKNQLGHIMNFMLDRPEMWQRCAEDRDFCDRVVDETLRHSGVATSYRNVDTEFIYRGVTIPKDTMLIFPLGIVCRYSGPFDDPSEFNPERENAKRHTVFGRGMHLCLGQFLARLQMAEGINLMAQRLQNPTRNGDLVWRLFPGVWGPLHLPIKFDAK